MDRQEQRTITTSGEDVRLSSSRSSYWLLGLRWLVRLFLMLFIAIAVSTWIDLFSSAEVYEQLIGSEHACAINYAYCSWRSYVLVHTILLLMSIAAIVVLAWRRLPRREVILNILATLALTYLAWSAIQVRLAE